MQEFNASITCDKCSISRDFTLTGFSKASDELIMLAERTGWDCDGEDLCAKCQAACEDDSESEEYLMDDEPCPKCGGTVGHLINCPDGIAFSKTPWAFGK